MVNIMWGYGPVFDDKTTLTNVYYVFQGIYEDVPRIIRIFVGLSLSGVICLMKRIQRQDMGNASEKYYENGYECAQI